LRLDAVETPGIELLRDLLDNLRAEPAQLAAQVIERWADKPGREHLEKLLQREELVSNATVASDELRAALVKLGELADLQRLETLQAKIGASGLTPDELQEFQRLTMKRPESEARR